MAFLYGDGTKSKLETNYLEFLRDVLDFAVQILLAEHRVRQCRGGGSTQRKAAEVELERLKKLSQDITRALDESAGAPADSTTSRCAGNIRQAASGAIKKAADHVKSSLAEELKKITDKVQRERSANLKALEKLLVRHDLPDSTYDISIRLDPQGGYIARLAGRAGVKVEWVTDLEIPSSHIFSSALRVERVSPHLEIKVPEKSGLVRKSMKLRTQKLASKYVTEVSRIGQETTIKLRATPDDSDAGYDLVIAARAPRVRLSRANKGGEVEQAFEPLEDDCARLIELYESLAAAATELARSRRALIDARLDGKSLGEHEDPSVLVSRLIDRMAPTVQEIARHSLSPNELVLKRLLGNDRREEVFVSKADLLGRIAPVPLELRGVFAPLALGDLSGGAGNSAAALAATNPAGPARADTASFDEEQTALSQKQPTVIVPPEERAVTEQVGGAGDRSIDVALAELERDG